MSAATSKTRVLIVATRPSLAAGLRSLLMADDLVVIGEAASLSAESAEAAGADVVVAADPSAEWLAGRRWAVPVVVVSRDPSLVRVLSSGPGLAWGVISPEPRAVELQAAVRAVTTGLTVLSPALAGLALPPLPVAPAGVGSDPRDPEAVESLTARERDVLQLLAEGMANRAIANALGISEHTVKFHLASIFGKLGASTRTDAVRRGLRRGLIQI